MAIAAGGSYYFGRVALLVLCAVFPTVFRLERGALLAVGSGLLLLAALREDRIRLHSSVFAWAIACALVGTLFILRGGYAGAPGFPRVITVYVLWPLVLTFAATAFASRASLWCASRGLLVAQLIICAYAVDFILVTARMLPAWAMPPIDLEQSISLGGGSIEISFHPLNSLLFLVPFSIAALMVWQFKQSRTLIATFAVAAIGIGVALVSGRRALQLVTVTSPLIALVLALFRGSVRSMAIRRFIILCSLGVALLLLMVGFAFNRLEIAPAVLWDAFSEGFESSNDLAANPRAAQFDVLLSEWSDQPMLGAGLGAAASGSVRSLEQPWAYELSYVALLYQVGVVGVLFYCCAVAWVYMSGIRAITRSDLDASMLIPLFTGLTCFLIGNATNPYLAAFDYLWTLFLPIAAINAVKIGGPWTFHSFQAPNGSVIESLRSSRGNPRDA